MKWRSHYSSPVLGQWDNRCIARTKMMDLKALTFNILRHCKSLFKLKWTFKDAFSHIHFYMFNFKLNAYQRDPELNDVPAQMAKTYDDLRNRENLRHGHPLFPNICPFLKKKLTLVFLQSKFTGIFSSTFTGWTFCSIGQSFSDKRIQSRSTQNITSSA